MPSISASNFATRRRSGGLIASITIPLLVLLSALPDCGLAFDHSYADWATVLTLYSDNGRVDYERLSKDRSQLDGFVSECGRVPYVEYEHWQRNEQYAFALNLYNAAMIELVLNNWPLRSLKDMGFFVSAWNIEFIPLFEHTISLGKLEHDVLRPSFKDPRVHFAIANAAIGGPWLRSEPYFPGQIDDQLDDQASVFLRARPECNRLEKNTLKLSPIFDWYGEDFGKRDGILSFARTYFPDLPQKPRLEYTKFDWSLNNK